MRAGDKNKNISDIEIKSTAFKNQYLLNLFERKYRSSIDKENATSSQIVFPVPRYRFPLQ